MGNDIQWAHLELDKQIAEMKLKGAWNDESRVHISNPLHRERISNIIKIEMLPEMRRILENTGLAHRFCVDGDSSEIQEEILVPELQMKFLVLILDNNDLLSLSSRYFCRLKTNISLRGFMMHTDFYVHFPDDIDLGKIKTIMGHSKFAGNPPTLKYEIGHDDSDGTLVLCFEYGKGYGYMTELPVRTMLADFGERMNFLQRLIRSIEWLSEDYNNDARMERVTTELVKCFEAW